MNKNSMRRHLSVLIFLAWSLLSGQISQGFADTGSAFKPDLTVGVYYTPIQSQVSREDFKVTFKLWLEEVTRNIKSIPVNVVMFDTIEAMRNAFNQGEIAFVIGPPFDLAKYFDRSSLAEGLSGITVDGQPNGLVVLVRTDQQIDSMQDLRGKRLVLPAFNELAEVFLDYSSLKTFRLPYQKVFGSVHYQPRYSAVIYDVFFGRADVAVSYLETYSVMLELNPQLAANVKVLATVPFMAPNYGYFHKNYPADLRKLWLENAIKLNQWPKAKQVLLNLNMGGITFCPVEALSPFDDLVAEYATLRKVNKH